MTQQREPDLPNEQAAEPASGLFVDLQRARSDAEREEFAARASNDIENAEYWNGRKSGFDFALTVLSDSVWKPVHADVYPHEHIVLSVEISVNRKTGVVSSILGGEWSDHHEFNDAYDVITEAACEIVGLNPEEYVISPAPRTVRLLQESVPAMDTWGEPLMLSESEVANSRFVYDDGQFVFLKLPDGQTVRVEQGDIEVEANWP